MKANIKIDVHWPSKVKVQIVFASTLYMNGYMNNKLWGNVC